MRESDVRTETVVIPGEPRMSNPVPPPVTVPLPILAWPHGPKNFWLGLFLLVNSLLFLSAAVLIVYGLAMTALGVFEFRATLKEVLVDLLLLAMCPYFLWSGVSWFGTALTCFWDASRSGPVLEITASGLRDYRSGLSIPWASVKRARILAHSVDLQLYGPVPNWQNPFRVGVVFQRYRPIPDRIIVSTGYLDVTGHVATYAILTLVKWSGGQVITKAPGYGGEIQRLIPRPSVKPLA